MTQEKEKKTTLYTIKITETQMLKLKEYLDYHLWEFYEVDYAHFGFKHDKVNVVGYKSGKLVVQGKKTEDFVINILEPEITGDPKLGYDEVHHPEWFETHGGMDESGKGDVFGPLVVATVLAEDSVIKDWMDAGIKDSKAIKSEKKILDLEKMIRKTKGVVVETAWANMPKYNELYQKFGNLNKLLAWFHARALETALEKKSVPWALLDQFSKQNLTKGYLKNHRDFDLRQRTKAEEDPVVAAASIVARAQYVKSLKLLEEKFGFAFPKGAGPLVDQTLDDLVGKFGPESLPEYSKCHFKNVKKHI